MALTSFARREHPDDFRIWRHVVVPWMGTLALLPALVITAYPAPAWPYGITPFLFVVALIFGFGYMQWHESRRPGVPACGATMLVGRRTGAGGGPACRHGITPQTCAAVGGGKRTEGRSRNAEI